MQRRQTLLLLAAGLLIASACRMGPVKVDDEPLGDQLWVTMEGYQEWGSFPGHEGMEPGKSPHGKFVRTFINDVAAGSTEAPAIGSILVKENFSADDPDKLNGLTVMQRIEGYDTENSDWFWVRYGTNGKVTHSGQVSLCVDCHFDAGGDDFVFLND